MAVPLLLAGPCAASPADRPNVVIFLADDMGFSDAGCFGSEIHTPNIDRLAAGGIRFTDFHNTARCWPSRAALLTGYYAQQVRRDTIPGVSFPTGARGVRPAWAGLLPALLKPLGYRSYHSGKWHIDGMPVRSGFDRSYYLEDTDRHFYPRRHFEDDVKLPPVKPGDGYYSSTAIADHAIKYLNEHAEKYHDQPFFLYVAFIAPHFPLQAPPEDIAKYKGRYDEGWDRIRTERWTRMKQLGILDCGLSARDPKTIPSWNLPESELKRRIGPGEVGYAVAWDSLTPQERQFQSAKMAVHAAMIDRMDQEIGRVLDQLRQMYASDNTLVLFMSDNGASPEQIIRGDGEDPAAPVGSARSFLGIGPGWSTACNTPLRLHKSWVHEGGISTPLIACWPRGIAAHGELRRNAGHLIDLAPTILDLAGGSWPRKFNGVQVPPPPGRSLVPVFTKDDSVSHDYLWWFHENHRAIRVGDWKAVSLGIHVPWELYDLRSDRSEMHDLADRDPQKTTDLSELWERKMKEFRELASRDAPAGAGVPENDAKLSQRLDAVFKRLDLPGAVVSGRVVELSTGRELYARDPDRPMMPASNGKLANDAAGLDHFGPAHQFMTYLAIDHGDLWLIGTGDPGPGDEDIAVSHGFKTMTILDRWAGALKARGVRHISGKLRFYDGTFDDQWIAPTWSGDYLTDWYAAPISGLTFNDNCIDTTVFPTAAGQPARYEVVPPTGIVKIINHVRTGGGDSDGIDRDPQSNTFTLRGNINITGKSRLESKPITDPGAFFADALRTALASHGITIDGPSERASRKDARKNWPELTDRILVDQSPDTFEPRVIAVNATPMTDVMWRINKNSQNLFAEAICKRQGRDWNLAHGKDEPGSWESGGEAIHDFLRRNHIDDTHYVLVDGSGLSREDRVTTRLITDLFALMARHRYAEAFQDSLTICGKDGTLKKRMTDIAGLVRGKTGSIGGVRSLSGYATTHSGQTLAFSFIFNGAEHHERQCESLADDACRVLVQWPKLDIGAPSQPSAR